MKHKACQKEHLRYLVRKKYVPKSHATYLEVLKQGDEVIDVRCYHKEHEPWDIKSYNYKAYNYYRPATEKDLPGIKQLVHKIKLECI